MLTIHKCGRKRRAVEIDHSAGNEASSGHLQRKPAATGRNGGGHERLV